MKPNQNESLPNEIIDFFERYKQAFNELNGQAVASLYRVPSVIVDDERYTIWDTYEKIENNMVALCVIYREHGFSKTSYETSKFILQNENFAVIDMKWTIENDNDKEPNIFNTTYNIQKIDGDWKINLVTAYSEKRLKRISS